MSQNSGERALALEALLHITEQGEFSHVVLKQTLDDHPGLGKQKRSFITRLVLGTLERQIELDYILNHYAKTKTAKMKPVIREILRMSVYQLKYMDSVPDHAAINEAVKLTQKKGFPGLKGFVNGVLRAIARDGGGKNVPLPADELQAASVRYSLPEWMLRLFFAAWDADTAKCMAEAFLKPEKTAVRCCVSRISPEELEERLEREIGAELPQKTAETGKKNSEKASEGSGEKDSANGGGENGKNSGKNSDEKGDESIGENRRVSARPHPYLPYALVIDGYDRLEDLPSFGEGLFCVQDVSSMLVGELAGVKPGWKIIDVCAAPGGKALHAAEMLLAEERKVSAGAAEQNKEQAEAGKQACKTEQPGAEERAGRGESCAGGEEISDAEKPRGRVYGHVEARDRTEYKVNLIRENAARLKLTNITAVCRDAALPDAENEGKADLVIADLPCSGLGVLGKKPDMKYRIQKEDLPKLQKLQRQILTRAQALVREGGILMYSTCTVNPGENIENVRWFLENFPEFRPDDISKRLCPKLAETQRRYTAGQGTAEPLKTAEKPAKKTAGMFAADGPAKEAAGTYTTDVPSKETAGTYTADVSAKEITGTYTEEEITSCCIQLLPGVHSCDGFFIARLKRKAQTKVQTACASGTGSTEG